MRVALGATGRAILWLVMGGACRMIAIGGVVGLGLALLLARSISTFLFGVPPIDPVTFAGVTVLLAVTAMAAAAAPAWRAARIDPVVTIRAD